MDSKLYMLKHKLRIDNLALEYCDHETKYVHWI